MRRFVAFALLVIAVMGLVPGAEAQERWKLELVGGMAAAVKSDEGSYWFELRTDAPTAEDWKFVLGELARIPSVAFNDIWVWRCAAGICGAARVKFQQQ